MLAKRRVGSSIIILIKCWSYKHNYLDESIRSANPKEDALQNYFAMHLFLLWIFIVRRKIRAGTPDIADKRAGIADKTSNIADKRAGIADKTSNIADKKARIADKVSNIA
ncbi:hypothetical protein ACQKOF_00150 [Lysinibacillus sp. NPDC093190]|uniref:hypothetical protein n=1 Tax=Lysinibacillus sp. NPDC093190 TaxID=3390575 RepID=UPI003CFEE8D4